MSRRPNVRERTDRFAEYVVQWLPEIVRDGGVPADTCILQTKVVVLMARELGLRAAPAPCWVMGFPPALAAKVVVDGKLVDDWYSTEGTALQVGGPRAQHTETHWDGHMGTLVEGRVFIDTSANQFKAKLQALVDARPFKVEVPKHFVRGEGEIALEGEAGSLYVYTHRPRDKSWLDQGWKVDPEERSLIRVAAEVARQRGIV